jgi:lipopolysaccharide/colanic/teichoic acid biosynthesis glycosyltransferase
LDIEVRRVPALASPQAIALPSPDDASPVRGLRESLAWSNSRRVIDVLIAAVVLLVLAPVVLAVALAIRLDSPGPLLFRQERIGRGCRRFTVLKFRTMYAGVSDDAHRAYIARLAGPEKDAAAGLKKLTDDPRVTRVGTYIRRTSLDEIPQLINVLKGEMSIIGPRPALEYELEHYEPEHFARFAVRPGLSGLWQVSGRNTIGFVGMLELDCEYARAQSARADAAILLRTPLALLRGNAA